MSYALVRNRPAAPHACARGVTLLEVLVAIFITGVGLLALLVLFPLGVLNLAQAIKDDRASALAADSAMLSRDGTELLSQTRDFIEDALLAGKADPQTVSALRLGYEQLEARAAELRRRLRELEPLAQRPRVRVQLLASLANVQAIETSAAKIATLLESLVQPNQDS
jgi:prepilin-type N-terminal cleavage/methylation domain-containing protein